MLITDLNRNQLEQVKIRYYGERHRDMSYGEISLIDNLVSDEAVFKEYDGVRFVPDDFF